MRPSRPGDTLIVSSIGYKKPIIVSENGFCHPDIVAPDGQVHDCERIEFTQDYLRELRRAAQDGVDIRGYFHWSLMDNFEWAEGYGPRFGLIHVDFATQKRTLKDSARWYREVIQSNGERV
jgi:beta-glucosidase